MKLPLIKKIEEIKDKIAASTKKLAPKVGGVVAAGVMLLGTSQGLAAQDDATPRAPYNPRVGDSATATVLNQFEMKISGQNIIISIIDVDGDGRTTDDQKMTAGESGWLKKNPQSQIQPGDRVIYIENQTSILQRIVSGYKKFR